VYFETRVQVMELSEIFTHKSHVNGCSPVCTPIWLFRLDLLVKILTHIAWKMPFTISASPHSLRLWAKDVSKRNFFLRTYTCMSRYIIPTREWFLTFLKRIKAFFALWLRQFYILFVKKFLSINAICYFITCCISFNTLKEKETLSGPVMQLDFEAFCSIGYATFTNTAAE
jgi:hypothetical protein